MRLSLGGSASFFGAGLETEGSGTELSACLRYKAEGGFELLAGPGSASGPIRLLVDPTTAACLSLGPPVEVDRSLESKTRVLGLGAGQLSLFGISRGGGDPQSIDAAAAGLCWEAEGGSGGFCAAAAASYGPPEAAAEGWRSDPAGEPGAAAFDGRDPAISLALIDSCRGEAASALASIAATWGRLSGPSLAFRLESRSRTGPLELGFAAGAASPRFRELAGGRLPRLFLASGEARLELRRAAALSASLAAQAEGKGFSLAPRWSEKGSLALEAPAGREGRKLETRLEAESGAEGGLSWALAFESRSGDSALSPVQSARVEGIASVEAGKGGLELSLETGLEAKGRLPALGLQLSISLPDLGSSKAPVLAKGAAKAALPFGQASSLELSLALGEAGMALGPQPQGAAGRASLSFLYRSSWR
jgi:hypothetical protein